MDAHLALGAMGRKRVLEAIEYQLRAVLFVLAAAIDDFRLSDEHLAAIGRKLAERDALAFVAREVVAQRRPEFLIVGKRSDAVRRLRAWVGMAAMGHGMLGHPEPVDVFGIFRQFLKLFLGRPEHLLEPPVEHRDGTRVAHVRAHARNGDQRLL